MVPDGPRDSLEMMSQHRPILQWNGFWKFKLLSLPNFCGESLEVPIASCSFSVFLSWMLLMIHCPRYACLASSCNCDLCMSTNFDRLGSFDCPYGSVWAWHPCNLHLHQNTPWSKYFLDWIAWVTALSGWSIPSLVHWQLWQKYFAWRLLR